MDKEEEEKVRTKLSELIGVGVITVAMSMFVLEGFGYVDVNAAWIWPLLITAGALILGLKKPFKRT